MVPDEILTRMPHKAALYRRETHYREAVADVADVLGDRAPDALWRAGLMMVKPDGLVAGRLRPVLDAIAGYGFALAWAAPVDITGAWREMWRHQLTVASLDRLMVNDLVFRGTGILLVLRAADDLDLPGTVWLSSRKGPADTRRQTPEDLRHRLGQINRILSFVHVADEPADLVRELGILLDGRTRRAALAALAGGGPDVDPDRLVDTWDPGERRDLRPEDAIGRIEASLADAGGAAPDAVRRARAALASMRAGERVSWRAFVADLDAAGVAPGRWDLVALGTRYITYDDDGESKVIENVERDRWRGRVPA